MEASTDIIEANHCSTDSASSFSFSDSSYERVLSELVDDCDNYNVASGKIDSTCSYDSTKDFVSEEQGSLNAVKSAIKDGNLSIDAVPSVTSDIATESLPVQVRKFQQTNLRSYIGIGNAPSTNTCTLAQVQPRSSGPPFTNNGHKARKGQISNVRVENPAPARTSTWGRRCPFYKKIPGKSKNVWYH